jgi:dephospho-CoA kinase
VIVIGLTGSIGMGKSTAASSFRRLGVPVFDADAAVRRLQGRNGAALPAIARSFPGTVKDGVLDRAILRNAVLSDPQKLRSLEKIMHPMVGSVQRHFLRRARGMGKKLAVLDMPLLFEGGGEKFCDHIVVVSAPLAVQIARVKKRGFMSEAQILAILAKQMPDAEKRARADSVIKTGLSRHASDRAIRRLTARLRTEAGA